MPLACQLSYKPAQHRPLPLSRRFASLPTAVGITGQLPAALDTATATAHGLPPDSRTPQQLQQPAASHQFLEDPTERLALALGLDINLLAHRCPRRRLGDCAAAVKRLRHALTNPLVDPDAGLHPDQHHMAATAASVAKRSRRRERAGRGEGAGIPEGLRTRVQPLAGLEAVAATIRGRLQVRWCVGLGVGGTVWRAGVSVVVAACVCWPRCALVHMYVSSV